MKYPFYKSLAVAGVMAVGGLVACSDDSESPTQGNESVPPFSSVGGVQSSSSNEGTNPVPVSSSGIADVPDYCSDLNLAVDAWILNLGDLRLILRADGSVTDKFGNVVALHDGGVIVGDDGIAIVDGIDYDALPVCPAVGQDIPPYSSAVIESPLSSSSEVEPGSSAVVDPTSSETLPTESSSSVEPVAPSGNPEEDVKQYPVPTLKNILGNGNNGWNTRYWDACKPHCSWAESGKDDRPDISSQAAYEKTLTSARNCNINDVEVPTFTYSKGLERYWIGYEGTPSACEIGEGGVFTCTDMAPVAVNDTLAYAFVAGNPSITTCGKCFHLQYDGSFADASENNKPKETHKALKGKHIIVMASNIGHDVKVGQFDLMVPGGGPGIFNALNLMVNRSDIEWGAQYGGFLTYCQQQLGYDKGLVDYQTCIKNMCDAAFADAGRPNLLRGCHWFADWFMAADNPTYQYEEIECPQYLVDKYMTTISTTVDTKVLYQADWSSYKGGELITTDACSPTPNGTGEYCDPDQLAVDKAKKY